MKIREISPSDPVSVLALDGLMESCPILEDAEFYTRDGNADSVKDAPVGETKVKISRGINEDNTATPPTKTYTTAPKKIISFDAKVDVVYEDRNIDPATELAQQTREQAWEDGHNLQTMFFAGDSGADAENFDGMVNLVDAGWTIPTATNGIQVPVGGDSVAATQQTAIETLLQHMARVRSGAQIGYMNEFLKIRLLTVGKALGYYRQTKDEFGNVVDRIGDTIIRGAGYQRNGTPNLPFTETQGSNTDCSSIYFVRWGERSRLTVLTSRGVVGRYPGQVGNFLINNVNFDIALVLQDKASLVRSTGWRL